jgi:hypothetical protein
MLDKNRLRIAMQKSGRLSCLHAAALKLICKSSV